jgi:hypothetical protein
MSVKCAVVNVVRVRQNIRKQFCPQLPIFAHRSLQILSLSPYHPTTYHLPHIVQEKRENSLKQICPPEPTEIDTWPPAPLMKVLATDTIPADTILPEDQDKIRHD